MTKKRGDDQHGYDPERAAARSLFDHLERQAEQRPDKPARKLGDVLKVPKVTPTTKRLIDAHAAIIDGPPDEIAFSHSVLCQTSLPYKPTDERVWIRDQGHVSLRIEAGAARHPDTGKWVDLPLPHDERPRLIMLHLNGEALRTGSPIIDVEGSMTAFVRALGIDTNGRNLRTLRDQLARLAAASIRLGIGSTTIKTDVIDAFDLWWPDDAKQRIMWPSTVHLAPRYFDSLTKHAVPLDSRAVAALAHSALDLDIYAWLAQRLHRIPEGKPQTIIPMPESSDLSLMTDRGGKGWFSMLCHGSELIGSGITWSALKAQFGVGYAELRIFRRRFKEALKAVLTAYPDARVEIADAGLVLWNSPPPVLKRQVSMPRLNPLIIDATATKITDP
jgi:hypothetical protein